VRELVIIASVTKEDLIHNELRRSPQILADIKWKIRVRLVYDLDHLVKILCRLLILEGLDSSKETKVEGV
jgi:translation initiation factor 2 beta subunit (eIF-2beta)/eIF-5